MKRKRLVLGLSSLVLVGTLLFFGSDGFTDWTGRPALVYVARALFKFGEWHYVHHLPVIDEVEICALGGEPADDDKDPFEGDGRHGVIARLTVRGKDAQEIADLWRSLPTGTRYQALCFSPVYGLRFRRDGRQVLKSSVCWECQALTFPIFGQTAEYGFDAQGGSGQQLLHTLQRHLPLPSRGDASKAK